LEQKQTKATKVNGKKMIGKKMKEANHNCSSFPADHLLANFPTRATRLGFLRATKVGQTGLRFLCDLLLLIACFSERRPEGRQGPAF
jgi:hypothetical protein